MWLQFKIVPSVKVSRKSLEKVHLFYFCFLLEKRIWRHQFGKTNKKRYRNQFRMPMQHFKTIAVVNQITREFFWATWSSKVFKNPNLNWVKVNKMLQSTLVIHWKTSKLIKMAILMRVFPSVQATAIYSS